MPNVFVPPDPFTLTEAEKATGLWQRLKAHFESEMALKRAKNDDLNLTEQQTASIRGHIACLKGLIALDE